MELEKWFKEIDNKCTKYTVILAAGNISHKGTKSVKLDGLYHDEVRTLMQLVEKQSGMEILVRPANEGAGD